MTGSASVQFPPDCEKVVRAIWDYLDGRVDSAQASEIEDHLAWCDHCVAHTEFERRLVGELSHLRRQHSNPEGLRARVLETLRGALNEKR